MRPTTDGYSLLETMIGVAVAALLLGLGVPEFADLIARNQRVAAFNNFVGSIQFARFEAAKRGSEIVLCPSLDQRECLTGTAEWQHGWIVFADRSPERPRQIDAGDELLLVRQTQPGVRMYSNRAAYVFRPFSRRSSNGTVSVCPHRPLVAPRAIIVSYTGRPRGDWTLPDGRPIECPETP